MPYVTVAKLLSCRYSKCVSKAPDGVCSVSAVTFAFLGFMSFSHLRLWYVQASASLSSDPSNLSFKELENNNQVLMRTRLK